MPTYEYVCKSCGHHLDVVQSFKEDPLTTCPACAGDLRKVFGSIGIAFKGSGFYRTDNRSSGSASRSEKGAKKADSSDSSGTSSGSSKGSEAKPAGGAGSAETKSA